MGCCAARVLTRAVAVVVVVASVAGCSPDRDRRPPPDPGRPAIVVASFDFPESELLGELYGQALRARGYPVELVARLGPREIVEPALEQGKADLVLEYMGTALNFLHERDRVATADPRLTHALLEKAFGPRGVRVLAPAPAEDRNGFVVTGDLARRNDLDEISDLAPIAGRLTFGGPPECPERPLCLKGLQEVYGLDFARFLALPSRQVTADALETGEVDVGMIETTDGSLHGSVDLQQLADDRGLQPADNVVPVLRRAVVDAYGPALVRLLDAVSAQLTTADLAAMNRRVVSEGQPVAEVAAGWLRSHTVAA
jgi:osmoprotectant transport system substrate-binding protein